MLEPPRLEGETITTALHVNYGLSVNALTFLPLGNDSASWAYRAQTSEGRTYFLKVRASEGFNEASLAIPHYLQERGVPHIIAPLMTINKMLWISANDFVLSLYPFIGGHIGADGGLSLEQWHTFGALMKQIHACRLPPELQQLVPRESFIPSRRQLITDLEVAISKQTFASAVEGELAAFWQARRDVIRLLMDRADELGHQLRGTSAPLVLCHADMHPWNVLLDGDQQLWLGTR